VKQSGGRSSAGGGFGPGPVKHQSSGQPQEPQEEDFQESGHDLLDQA
jgi:hypothetical protein